MASGTTLRGITATDEVRSQFCPRFGDPSRGSASCPFPGRWWNVDGGESVLRVELRPALETEVFFETFFGLARDGKTNAQGIPGLLQIAGAYSELGDSCPQVVKPPLFIQRLLFRLLAPVGRALGRLAVYRSYSPDRVNRES